MSNSNHSNEKVEISIALMGCLGAVLAAIIGGLFLLISVGKIQIGSPIPTDEPIIITTPSSTDLPKSPIEDDCPTPGSYSIRFEELKPNITITGPASIHPSDGGMELAKILGLEWTPYWGSNIFSGTTVKIPDFIQLNNGKNYEPQGSVFYYQNDARMLAGEQCWITNPQNTKYTVRGHKITLFTLVGIILYARVEYNMRPLLCSNKPP